MGAVGQQDIETIGTEVKNMAFDHKLRTSFSNHTFYIGMEDGLKHLILLDIP